MTEPRSDGVDIHAGSEEMDSGRVAHRMGAYPFALERGDPCGGAGGDALDRRVDAEPRQRLTPYV